MHAIDQSTKKTFINLLKVAALLPYQLKEIAERYGLSRKQVYLIFLVGVDAQENSWSLKDYADMLAVDKSTLSRNIDKLVSEKIIERVKTPGAREVHLSLLSQGQLYFWDINSYFQGHFEQLKRERGKLLDKVENLGI
jgi:DNA-binding MarR family transcriptional regulator